MLADQAGAERTLARIRAAHGAVEDARGARIPEWANRDVLYLLVASVLRRNIRRASAASTGKESNVCNW
ncbi:hypothetical protein [Deinococcus apachensis]|uniref:hypothetical protein n=1 Tax=Deinococcus apachensis TaxID=309886 RepID=UPI003CCBBBE3